MPLTLNAAGDDDGRRLDKILRKALRELPLSAIHRMLRKGAVLVDGETAAAERRIRAGETITVADAALSQARDRGAEMEGASANAAGEKKPAKTRLAAGVVLYEGAGLLIINKPAGLEVHGRESLEEQVRSYLKPKLPPSLSFRPGPLHRLDKPSSGIIVFSTNLEGARVFSALMRDRKIAKYYLALVEGVIKKAEVWRDELIRDRGRNKTFAMDPGAMMVDSSRPSADFVRAAGETTAKTALTRVSPLAGNAACTLVRVEIETGRTHQIRAQAAGRGHPLAGDKKYGGRAFSGMPDKSSGAHSGFLLHAWRMEFPMETPFPRMVQAPLPEYFKRKICGLFGEKVLALIANE